jgi:DUF1365 family protein
MSSMLARHPAMAQRVSLAIYRNAASLLVKGVPYHPHPVCPAMTPEPSQGPVHASGRRAS